MYPESEPQGEQVEIQDTQVEQQVQPDPPSMKLWKGLKKMDLYSKDYNNFVKQYSDPAEITRLHKGLVERELYSNKDESAFVNQYFPELKKKEQAQVVPPSGVGSQVGASQLESTTPTVAQETPKATTEQPLTPSVQAEQPLVADIKVLPEVIVGKQKKEAPTENIFDAATQYNELKNAKVSGGEVSVDVAGDVIIPEDVPDEAKIAEAKKIKDKYPKLNLDEIYEKTKSLTPEDYLIPGYSKEELQDNFINNKPWFDTKINGRIWRRGITESLNEARDNGYINRDQKNNIVRSINGSLETIGKANFSFEDDRERVKSLYNAIQTYGGQNTSNILQPFANDFALSYGNAFNRGFENTYANAPENKYLTPSELLAYYYKKDTNPESAKQYEKLFTDFDKIKDDPDAVRGYDKLKLALNEQSISLRSNTIEEKLNRLSQIAKQNGNKLPDEQFQQYEKLKNQKEDLINESEALDEKYPELTTNKRVNEAIQETIGQQFTGLTYTAGRAGEAIVSGAESIGLLLKTPFLSDSERNAEELSLLGEPDPMYSSQATKAVKTEALTMKPELKEQVDKIVNDSNLNWNEKRAKLWPLFYQNKNDFGKIPIYNGKVDINPTTVYYSISDLASSLVPFFLVEAATGGIGGAGAGARFLRTANAAFTTGFKDVYKNELAIGSANPIQKAFVITLINGGAMAGAGTLNNLKALYKNNPVASKILEKMTEAEYSAALKSYPEVWNKTIQKLNIGKRLQALPGQYLGGVKSGLEFEALTKVAELVEESSGLKEKSENKIAGLKQAVVNAFIGFPIFHTITAQAGYKTPNELDKASFLTAGRDPNTYLFEADKSLKNGEITQQQHNEIVTNIKKTADTVKKIGFVNDKGEPLSEKDQADLLYLKLQEKDLTEEINKDLPEPVRKKLGEQILEIKDKVNDIYKGNLVEEETSSVIVGGDLQKGDNIISKDGRVGKIIEMNEKGDAVVLDEKDGFRYQIKAEDIYRETAEQTAAREAEGKSEPKTAEETVATTTEVKPTGEEVTTTVEMTPEEKDIEDRRAVAIKEFEANPNLMGVEGKEVLVTPEGTITRETINADFDKEKESLKPTETAPPTQTGASAKVQQLRQRMGLGEATGPKKYTMATIKALDTTPYEGNAKEVAKGIKNMMKAVASLVGKSTGEKLNVNIYDTPESYKKGVLESGGSERDFRTKGFYFSKDGSVHLNMTAVTKDTGPHEFFHPVLDYMAMKRPDIIKNLHDQLKQLDQGAKIVNQNELRYKDRSVETQQKEAITDYIAQVASGQIKLDRTNWEAIRDFIITALDKVGLNLSKDINSITDLQKLAKQIDRQFKSGQELRGEEVKKEDQIKTKEQQFQTEKLFKTDKTKIEKELPLQPKQKENESEQLGRSEQAGDRGGRNQSRNLAPLEGSPIIKGATGPDGNLVAAAEKYARDNGIPIKRQGEYAKVDEDRAVRIADAYENMKHDPTDPKVKAAYDDLIRQTKDQYQALIDSGYEFTFFDEKSDPYNSNPYEAMRDLRNNKKMAVYGTYDGFGTEGITATELESNPMLQDTGLKWKDQNGVEHPVTANDLFRAVHDAFGHGLEGSGFRARGEENAWQAHVRLFTGDAIAAMTTETRGQNSWLNYGPYGEKNKNAKVKDTVFAEQKTGLMPEWTWTEGRVNNMPEQATGKNKTASDLLNQYEKGTVINSKEISEKGKSSDNIINKVFELFSDKFKTIKISGKRSNEGAAFYDKSNKQIDINKNSSHWQSVEAESLIDSLAHEHTHHLLQESANNKKIEGELEEIKNDLINNRPENMTDAESSIFNFMTAEKNSPQEILTYAVSNPEIRKFLTPYAEKLNKISNEIIGEDIITKDTGTLFSRGEEGKSELQNFVEEERAAGTSDADIRATLEEFAQDPKANLDAAKIDELMAAPKVEKAEVTPEPTPKPRPSKKVVVKETEHPFLYEGTDRTRVRGIMDHIANAKNISQKTKEGFKLKGAEYAVANNAEARVVAKDIIKAFGKEDALTIAEDFDLHPSVRSAVFAELIDNAYREGKKAKTKEGKLLAAEEWRNLVNSYGKRLTESGQFSAYAGHFYKTSPLGFVMVENDKTQKRFEEFESDKVESFDKLWDQLNKTEGGKLKIEEEVEKLRKAERVTERKKNTKNIDDFFNKMKEKGSSNYGDAGTYFSREQAAQNPSPRIPKDVWDSAMDAMNTETKNGETVPNAVQKGIDIISESIGDKWNKEKFRSDYEELISRVADGNNKEKPTVDLIKKKIEDLEATIKDYEERIAKGGVPGEKRKEKFSDVEEVKKLIEERDKLRKENQNLVRESRKSSGEMSKSEEAIQKRIEDLEAELQRVKERRQKEKVEPNTPAEKKITEREKELKEAIQAENEKWDNEIDSARQQAKDYQKLETERNRQIARVTELKKKLDTLQQGQLPEGKKTEPKVDTPEIEALKKEIETTEKEVRKNLAHQRKLEGLENELQRLKDRKEKEKDSEKRTEYSDEEVSLRKQIEDERGAWKVEKNIDKLNEELNRVRARQERVTDPKQKRELTAEENRIAEEIKAEKKRWAEELAPQKKADADIKRKQARIAELNRRVAEGDFSAEQYKAKKAKDALDIELENAKKLYDQARKQSPEYIKKKAEQFLEQFKERIEGVSEEKKAEMVRRAIKKIIDSGGLEREEFKQIVADVMGFKKLTDEQATEIEDLNEKINSISDLEDAMINDPTPENIAAYEAARIEGMDAAMRIFNMTHKEADIAGTLKSLVSGGLLGIPTLIMNVGQNVITNTTIRLPKAVIKQMGDLGIYGVSALMNQFRNTKVFFSPSDLIKAQKGYFKMGKKGLQLGAVNFMKGTQMRDYLSETSYQSTLAPKKAMEDLKLWRAGEKYLTKAEVIDKLIKSSIISKQANFILKGMGFGDLPFRWAAEGATAIQIATKELKLSDPNEIEAFMLSPQKYANKVFIKNGESADVAAQKSEEIKERILNEGKKAVFEEENLLTMINSGVENLLKSKGESGFTAKVLKPVGSVLKTTQYPFLKIPSNIAWQYFKIMNPELSFSYGAGQLAIAAYYYKKGNVKEAKAYSVRGKDSIATGILGLGVAVAASSIISSGLVRSSNDEDNKIRETTGERAYGKQNQLNFGKLIGGSDYYIDLKWFGALGSMLNTKTKIAEAELQKKLKGDTTLSNEFVNDLGYSSTSAMNGLVFDQGAKIVDAIKKGDAGASWLASQANTLENVFFGATFAAISRAALPEEARSKGDGILDEINNNMKARNLFYRWAAGYPPSRISIWGEPIKKDNSVGGMLGSMFGFQKGSSDLFGAILYDDVKRTGDARFFPVPEDNKITVNDKEVEITQKEKDELDTYIGQYRKTLVSSFVYDMGKINDEQLKYDDKKYSELNDAEKIEALKYLYDAAREAGFNKFIEAHQDNPVYKIAELDMDKKIEQKYKEINAKFFKKDIEGALDQTPKSIRKKFGGS